MPVIINGTNGISGADGSATTPALQGTDTNTGVYFPAADTVAVATNGAARITVDSTGRVGIGTTSPATLLDLSTTTAAKLNLTHPGFGIATLASDSTGALLLQADEANTQASSLIQFKVDGTEAARIDSSRRLLVGTSSARSPFSNNPLLQVENQGSNNAIVSSFTYNSNTNVGAALAFIKSRGTSSGAVTAVQSGDDLCVFEFAGTDGTAPIVAARISAQVDGTPGANNMPGRLVLSTTASGASSPTERMRLDSSGVVKIQTTLGLRYLGVDTGFLGYDPQNAGATAGVVSVVCRGNDGSGSGASGVSLSRSATTWGTYSDERGKTNLTPILNGLSKIATLRSVTGRYLTDEDGTSRSFLIAQDVQAVLPEAVDAGNPDKLSLRYTEVIPLLVAALKESKERIETLEARLAALEAA